MKIAIVGPHGVGKSTLTFSLKAREIFRSFAVQEEPTKKALEAGYNISEEISEKAQLYMTCLQACTLLDNRDTIIDRSIIDGYVYCKWAYGKELVSLETLNAHEGLLHALPAYYDCIIYLTGKNQQELEDNGIRSTDRAFFEEIRAIFDETMAYLQQKGLCKNVIAIDTVESIEHRTNYVLGRLNELKLLGDENDDF